MLSGCRNLLTSLVKTERITTTMAKAKEVKKHADRLVSMGAFPLRTD